MSQTLKRKGIAVLSAVTVSVFAFKLFAPTLNDWDGNYIDQLKRESDTPPHQTPLSLLDTTYFTLTTATTVGTGDISPHSKPARTITTLMLVAMLTGLIFA